MIRAVWRGATQCAAIVVGLMLSASIALAGDIEGTWRLTKRVLPDGTVVLPPAVQGMGTAINGFRHLNVFWQTPEGKPGSYGLVSKYRLSANTYTETILASAFDDGSGGPIQRGVAGDTKSAPVSRQDGRVSYQLPFDPPKVVFDGDRMTATLEGAFVDHWERVK